MPDFARSRLGGLLFVGWSLNRKLRIAVQAAVHVTRAAVLYRGCLNRLDGSTDRTQRGGIGGHEHLPNSRILAECTRSS